MSDRSAPTSGLFCICCDFLAYLLYMWTQNAFVTLTSNLCSIRKWGLAAPHHGSPEPKLNYCLARQPSPVGDPNVFFGNVGMPSSGQNISQLTLLKIQTSLTYNVFVSSFWIISPPASRRAIIGQTQLHGDDSLHQQAWESQADDESAKRQESQHPVWGLPCFQGKNAALSKTSQLGSEELIDVIQVVCVFFCLCYSVHSLNL